MTQKRSVRHMVNMLHLPSIRSSRESPGTPNGMEPDAVDVHTYMRGNLVIPWREGLTVEHVCTKAAKECGILRLTSNLFALYDKTNKVWLCPTARVHSRRQKPSQELEYRVRFHTATMCPSGDSQRFMLLEENVVNYMFHQYRESFLNDEVMGLSTEESLGLMVLDFMQHVKEEGNTLTNLNGRMRFGRFLPKSLSEGLSWWDKVKLRRKVRTALKDFRDDPREAFAFRVMFLVSLSEEMKLKWGIEQFTMVNGDIYEVSGIKGVTKKKFAYGNEDVVESFAFDDIIDVIIYPPTIDRVHTMLQINRRSTPPMFLEMESLGDAQSFACLLDGYYRLLVDYYHYLSESIAPPSIVKLTSNKCHGPIPLSKAKQKIDDIFGRQEGVYLIRQNPVDHYSYCLTVRIHTNQELKNFKINHYEEDDKVGLDNQGRFDSLKQFVEHYRKRENSWCLEGQLRKGVPIEPKDKALRIFDRSALKEDLPPQPDVGPIIRWIPEDSLSKDLILLGEGTFTQVWKADLRKKVGNKTRITTVAIKCPKMDAPQIVQQKFSQTVDQMASWEHSHIIRFEGIGGGYKLVMQYASEGPLDRYMRRMADSEGRRLGLTSQLTTAYQLMDALEYLETKRYAHGNVSAHNVLVSRSAPEIIIKLADPMLGAYYHSLDMTSQPKLQRARWTAPELLVTNSEPTYAGDKFSYAITLWQIMSHGAIPAHDISDDMVRTNYRHGIRLDPPKECPVVLLKIMEACWSHNSANRPPCKGILRDIHNLLELSRDKPEFRDYGEVAMIPTESDDEDDDHTNLDNVDNERRDIISPPNSSSDGGPGTVSGLGRGAGATGGAAILDRIAKHLNAEDDDDIFDPEEETRFYGVNRIPNGELKREGQLGKGNFGTVFRAVLKPRHNLPAETVAVKVLIKSESKPEQFHQEIRALSYCDHKNIVKVIGYCEDSSSDNSNYLSLVMEYLPLGSLEKYIQERQDRVSHKTLYLFGQQICQGMKYLHEERMMVHRDLAARNVLVASENEVKITDFGLARIFGTEKDYYRAKEVGQKVPVKWYAPEWLRHNKYQKESDVWSFGVVLWEMFSYGGKIHYRDHRGVEVSHGDLLDFLEKGNRLPPPPSCPSAIDTMMQHCWRFDPKERPKFHALIFRLGNLVQQSERGEMGSSSSSYGL